MRYQKRALNQLIKEVNGITAGWEPSSALDHVQGRHRAEKKSDFKLKYLNKALDNISL
jgi:hypothetical protein